jgi:hypothetical protein
VEGSAGHRRGGDCGSLSHRPSAGLGVILSGAKDLASRLALLDSSLDSE